MNTLTTRNTTLSPFERLNFLLEDMWPTATFVRGAWNPVVDILEDENSYRFEVELPGMNREDFEVRMAGDTLTIQGHRNETKEIKGEGYIRRERSFGNFYRSFRLESPVKEKDITAEYTNGILHVKVPKTAAVKATRIAIK